MDMPLITEIQRFSLQDGPGIRTTLFVKGCHLHCPWCHNPEGQRSSAELFYHEDRCTHCFRCVKACPHGALTPVETPNQPLRLAFDRGRCQRCMHCVSACLCGARESVGQAMSMEDMLRELAADKPFFESSGGGVTISGGEPLLFPGFVSSTCLALEKEGIHVALETSACVKQTVLEPFVNVVDLFIIDVKTLNPDLHRNVIGGSLTLVLKNIEGLIAANASIRLHIPVITGFNDTIDDFHQYAAYVGTIAAYIDGVDILPYHCYGEAKYAALGRKIESVYYKSGNMPAEKVRPLVQLLKTQGVEGLTIGGMAGVIERDTHSSVESGL